MAAHWHIIREYSTPLTCKWHSENAPLLHACKWHNENAFTVSSQWIEEKYGTGLARFLFNEDYTFFKSSYDMNDLSLTRYSCHWSYYSEIATKCSSHLVCRKSWIFRCQNIFGQPSVCENKYMKIYAHMNSNVVRDLCLIISIYNPHWYDGGMGTGCSRQMVQALWILMVGEGVHLFWPDNLGEPLTRDAVINMTVQSHTICILVITPVRWLDIT